LVLEHQRSLNTSEDRETIVGLSVPVRLGGKRGLLRDAAAARREQASFDAHATLFDSAISFREAYVTAVVDRARVEVLTEQQAVLDALSATIQGLSKGGEVAAYDLLRQQTQARLHRRLVQSAKARAQASRVLLEAWIGSEVVLPPVALADLARGPRDDVQPADRLVARHPRLRSLQAESRASSFEARAARRRWVPDPEVFAGYRAAPAGAVMGHGISLGLTIPLTFFDHGQGDAALAEAESEVARATAASLERKQQKLLESARAQLTVLEASVEEADTAARDAVTIQSKAKALYAGGEASITEILEAFRVAEEARVARIELAQEIALARLAMMRAAGSLFDAALDRACSAPPASAR
jgi:cobalt-zinc-cadmium efflux system outer membrane protein